jgi:hypothetical protein
MNAREPNDQPADREELQRMREAFFGKTRLGAGVLYAFFALIAVALGASAFSAEPGPAVAGALVGIALGAAAHIVNMRVPITARTTRALIIAVAVGGFFFVRFAIGDLSGGREAALDGAFAGAATAAIAGVAYVRRRLARDDELFLRQQGLGFDPERPWRWLR